MEGYERKNKKEIHKEFQDLDTKGSPPLRGDFDWWKDRSRSPLSFPSRR
jgi:hypothetical protein